MLKDEELTVSSSGGFLCGVTIENLLRVPPTPRNPRLADAFKRLGLSERTGRGVDIIYEGLLRNGRPPPSYRRSTATSVVVAMDARPADLKFVEAIVTEERKRQRQLSLNALLVLAKLKSVKRAQLSDLAHALQSQDMDDARAAVEELVEAGLLQAHGTGKGRSYTMSAALYRQLGQKAEQVRQAWFEPEQQRQMVLNYVRKHGSVKRADVMELCGLNGDQASCLWSSADCPVALPLPGQIVVAGHPERFGAGAPGGFRRPSPVPRFS
jgi:ATP-dependent DNA helicase RecG